MDVALFDYELPEELIAQHAAEPRAAARLLLLERRTGRTEQYRVRDLPRLLKEGDLLVVNDTRVVPARLIGRKATGGRVEVFLLERQAREGPSRERWRAWLGASKMPPPGALLEFDGDLSAEVLRLPGADGAAEVALTSSGSVAAAIDRLGRPPLPPYIRREDDDPRTAEDRRRYQTIFAERAGAVAAPTAGLHFDEALLGALERRGVSLTSLTLHVGEGTFRPIRERRVEEIRLHPERFHLGAGTASAIVAARRRGGRVIAVGTTVVRTLESRPPTPLGGPEPGAGSTSLFIGPGHEFRYIDGLLTNFHLPRSSLLILVASFGGRERVLAAYREAVRSRFRFYSYGDAMLVI